MFPALGRPVDKGADEPGAMSNGGGSTGLVLRPAGRGERLIWPGGEDWIVADWAGLVSNPLAPSSRAAARRKLCWESLRAMPLAAIPLMRFQPSAKYLSC
jgi:hypothetical protein